MGFSPSVTDRQMNLRAGGGQWSGGGPSPKRMDRRPAPPSSRLLPAEAKNLCISVGFALAVPPSHTPSQPVSPSRPPESTSPERPRRGLPPCSECGHKAFDPLMLLQPRLSFCPVWLSVFSASVSKIRLMMLNLNVHQSHQGDVLKCRFLGPTPRDHRQRAWGWEQTPTLFTRTP